MENPLKEITPEMTRTVNELINRDFSDATVDEVKMYAEWVKIHALHDEEVEQRRKERNAIIRQRLEDSKKQTDASLEALNALTELANAKLRAVENGETK